MIVVISLYEGHWANSLIILLVLRDWWLCRPCVSRKMLHEVDCLGGFAGLGVGEEVGV